jgi:hypothetical protein
VTYACSETAVDVSAERRHVETQRTEAPNLATMEDWHHPSTFNVSLSHSLPTTAVESGNVALDVHELDDQTVPFPPLFSTEAEVPATRRQRDTLTVESESSALIGEWMNSIMSEALVCCSHLTLRRQIMC